LESVLEAAGIEARLGNPATDSWLHPVESGVILAAQGKVPAGAGILLGAKRTQAKGDTTIGSFGVLHPRVLSQFDLKGPVLVAEISLSGLLAAPPRGRKFAAFGQYSSSSRDLNLLVDEGRAHGDILARMPISRIPILKEVRLNSVYRGTGIPPGKKALHYTFTYRHAEKTLTDDEVNKAQEKLNQELAKDDGIVFK
jgi:phenylalanyl-tRNA synthetase beta chain